MVKASVGMKRPVFDANFLVKGMVQQELTHQQGVGVVKMLEQVRDCYRWNDPEVDAFLVQHYHVQSILLNALKPIRTIFGPELQLRLCLYDLSGDEMDQVLFAQIESKLEVREAMARLKDFLNRWFVDQMVETQGKLSFDVI